MSQIDWVLVLQWLFGGVGGAFVIWLLTLWFGPKEKEVPVPAVGNANTNHNVVNVHVNGTNSTEQGTPSKAITDSATRKKLTNILFVDDKTNFKVVSILKNSGWQNTKIRKDLKSLDESDVIEAHICFVDINGVGKLLGFKDEGLGLAAAIKGKYPDKKVVIYSAQEDGDRFHDALRKVDATIRKDANPYEFQNLVETFSESIFSK